MKRALWVAMLAGCGASTAPPPQSPGCGPASERAESAWARVADLSAADADRATPAATPIDDAVARLDRHLAQLRDNPVEVEGDVAMEVSGAVMDALDELGPEVPAALRERCDDAAEALLTDRSAIGSERAARDARGGLESALAATRPEAAAGRGVRRGLVRIARRAASAAGGYAAGVRVGDRHAARAEQTPVPDDAPAELVESRTAAVEASREAREICGFSRALAVPSL